MSYVLIMAATRSIWMDGDSVVPANKDSEKLGRREKEVGCDLTSNRVNTFLHLAQ